MDRRISFDPTLYAIADADALPADGFSDFVAQAIDGGVTAVQVRAKGLSDSRFVSFASEILEVARHAGVPVVVNDRADIALAGGAEGVHLGGEDLSPELARRLLGEKAVIGVTAHDLGEVARAEEVGADYVSFGAVFESPSKQMSQVQGLEGLSRARGTTRLPLVAIGGITVERAAAVVAAGADGIAVISGLWSAEDVRLRAAEFRAAIEQGRKRREAD
jgi:thiamine-phosphate diphosphorylase